MKVYVVGDDGPEHNSVASIHRSYKGAFNAWDVLRKKLLAEAKEFLKRAKLGRDMYEAIIKNLSCKNPEKIDNYPHETPYIREYELKV